MKRILMPLAFMAAVTMTDFASANTTTDEERRLVSFAEEIAASEMDDDEKIVRLTEIEARVSRIRKDRAAPAESRVTDNKPSETPKAVRPLSTYVESQTRSTLESSPDEDEPTWLSKFFFAAVNYVGIALAIGVAVLIASQLFVETLAFVERKTGLSIWPSLHRIATPAEAAPNPENPAVPAGNAPAPVRKTSARIVRKKPVVPRDGMVPPHLR